MNNYAEKSLRVRDFDYSEYQSIQYEYAWFYTVATVSQTYDTGITAVSSTHTVSVYA